MSDTQKDHSDFLHDGIKNGFIKIGKFGETSWDVDKFSSSDIAIGYLIHSTDKKSQKK